MNKLPVNLINDVAKQYKTGHLDPHQLIKQSLIKYNKYKELNAFISCTSELALAKSIESSHRYKNGKPLSNLDGIPIAIKDNFCVKNVTTTTCGSKMLLNFIPTYNATVYEKLERLGAILIGKTNLDEFGMGSGTIDSYFGPTKNIWSKSLTDDNWNIVGGSSGGSAVSVAAGITYAALGSDTGGSTRNPASYCGVVGLKPTYGLLSRHGLIPLVNSMDVPGILTQSIDDCTIILNALAGPDPLDSTTIKSEFNEITIPCIEDISIENIKIGIPKEYHCMGLSNEMLDTWIKVADLLENAGAQLKSISLPHTFASIYIYSILNPCEVASNMARYDGIEYGHRSDENYSTEQLYAKTRAEGFNNVVKNRILTGNFFLLRKNYDQYFQTALKIRRLILNDFNNVFRNCTNNINKAAGGELSSASTPVDVILTPTTLTDAPFYKDFIQNNNRDQCAVQDYCTQAANMAGIPAISIPIRLSSNGLPLSLQLMGPNLSEKLLLTIAKWIEHQVKFPIWNVQE